MKAVRARIQVGWWLEVDDGSVVSKKINGTEHGLIGIMDAGDSDKFPEEAKRVASYMVESTKHTIQKLIEDGIIENPISMRPKKIEK